MSERTNERTGGMKRNETKWNEPIYLSWLRSLPLIYLYFAVCRLDRKILHRRSRNYYCKLEYPTDTHAINSILFIFFLSLSFARHLPFLPLVVGLSICASTLVVVVFDRLHARSRYSTFFVSLLFDACKMCMDANGKRFTRTKQKYFVWGTWNERENWRRRNFLNEKSSNKHLLKRSRRHRRRLCCLCELISLSQLVGCAHLRLPSDAKRTLLKYCQFIAGLLLCYEFLFLDFISSPCCCCRSCRISHHCIQIQHDDSEKQHQKDAVWISSKKKYINAECRQTESNKIPFFCVLFLLPGLADETYKYMYNNNNNKKNISRPFGFARFSVAPSSSHHLRRRHTTAQRRWFVHRRHGASSLSLSLSIACYFEHIYLNI